MASRDAQVTRLLASAKNVTGTLAAESDTFAKLLGDGNLFLAELQPALEKERYVWMSPLRDIAKALSAILHAGHAREVIGPAASSTRNA